jgi:hypothetical protein
MAELKMRRKLEKLDERGDAIEKVMGNRNCNY